MGRAEKGPREIPGRRLEAQGGKLPLGAGGGRRRRGVELDREVLEPEDDELGELGLKGRAVLTHAAERAQDPLEVRLAFDGRNERAGLAVARPQPRDDLFVGRRRDGRGNLLFR